ncbi:uncharacterized protein MONBRDRAFT_32460 [Monosiga brevicollis MX1]|uniref:UBC core domain-containing protein n=1 Tax=Monosiga brevicollis TaxID=81824 RepID=A9UZM5_MONBE|nr:uncharacterized protein MONBRDRAFT_32460 [Monosiga brevicollis MX1]EDQ89258.1 predicted protein [Monosiga brevicollis MX1]|eukprot:XP_001745834.1 hypothetical protein [Monosiga brevicollis MX1]
MTLMMSGDASVTAFPEGDNLFCWKGTIAGGKDTIYEGLAYKVTITFPNNYPYSAPTVKFDTPCYHPNVDETHGHICIDILKDQWSASYDVRTVLLSIQAMLGDPNVDSPLNGEAAQLYQNRDVYKAQVHQHYRQHAQAC